MRLHKATATTTTTRVFSGKYLTVDDNAWRKCKCNKKTAENLRKIIYDKTHASLFFSIAANMVLNSDKNYALRPKKYKN